jgi:hypothetical protein
MDDIVVLFNDFEFAFLVWVFEDLMACWTTMSSKISHMVFI